MCTVTLKFSVCKQIFTAFVFTFILKSVHLQQCSELSLNKKHFGQRLVGFNIGTSIEESIGACVKKCFQLTHCLSTNFNTVSKQCDLNNITADEMTTAVVKSDTSILSDLTSWPKAMVGPCKDKPCYGRDICLPAGSSFSCHNTDCPNAPLIGNATSTGSVEIGGIMAYTCTKPFRRIGQGYIQCGLMNTWSSNIEIKCNEGIGECSEYLLPSIPDNQMTASSDANSVYTTSALGAHQARLNGVSHITADGRRSAGAWITFTTYGVPWIQIQFNSSTIVNGIATQGRFYDRSVNYWDERVTKYTVSYSGDCSTFTPILDTDGQIKTFTGNLIENSNAIQTNRLELPVYALCVRLYHTERSERSMTVNMVSMRLDIIGCIGECSEYLVPSIPDNQMTASSDANSVYTSSDLGAHQARLNGVSHITADGRTSAGAWITYTTYGVPWIQIQFNSPTIVNGIATQGRFYDASVSNIDERVTKYTVSYSGDCSTFTPILHTDGHIKNFTGNLIENSNAIQTNRLELPVYALCVRLYPTERSERAMTHNVVSMRLDIIGCEYNKD